MKLDYDFEDDKLFVGDLEEEPEDDEDEDGDGYDIEDYDEDNKLDEDIPNDVDEDDISDDLKFDRKSKSTKNTDDKKGKGKMGKTFNGSCYSCGNVDTQRRTVQQQDKDLTEFVTIVGLMGHSAKLCPNP